MDRPHVEECEACREDLARVEVARVEGNLDVFELSAPDHWTLLRAAAALLECERAIPMAAHFGRVGGQPRLLLVTRPRDVPATAAAPPPSNGSSPPPGTEAPRP